MGPQQLTTLSNNKKNSLLKKKFHSCRGHHLSFQRNLPSPRKSWVWQHTCPKSTHFPCNRLKSQHCAAMTKQPRAWQCNHHTESWSRNLAWLDTSLRNAFLDGLAGPWYTGQVAELRQFPGNQRTAYPEYIWATVPEHEWGVWIRRLLAAISILVLLFSGWGI